jgi:hypothetical protein
MILAIGGIVWFCSGSVVLAQNQVLQKKTTPYDARLNKQILMVRSFSRCKTCERTRNGDLVNHCIAFFNNEQHAITARKYFHSLTDRQLVHRLQYALSQHQSGTIEATSIAFVLAYRGVTPQQNIFRMLRYAKHKKCDVILAMNLLVLYSLREEEYILREFLRLRLTEVQNEALAFLRTREFLNRPEITLRLATLNREIFMRLKEDQKYIQTIPSLTSKMLLCLQQHSSKLGIDTTNTAKRLLLSLKETH